MAADQRLIRHQHRSVLGKDLDPRVHPARGHVGVEIRVGPDQRLARCFQIDVRAGGQRQHNEHAHGEILRV